MSPLIDSMDRMVRDIPAMPAVAQKVMHMLGDPRTTNSTLGSTLSSDMAMASRVLQMANSPFFGTRQKITSISQAIFVLGHAALRSLIITVCTKGIFKNPGLMEEKVWEHGMGTGVAARSIAEKTKLMDPDEAFLGGLLHDVGRMILIVVYRSEYQKIFEKSYNENLSLLEIMDLEKQEFGYDHAEIGSRVIVKWRLPAMFGRICRRHHTVKAEILDQEEDSSAIALVAQANLISVRLGLGGHEPDKRIEVVDTPFNQRLNIDKDMILALVEETWKTYKEYRDQFVL